MISFGLGHVRSSLECIGHLVIEKGGLEVVRFHHSTGQIDLSVPEIVLDSDRSGEQRDVEGRPDRVGRL